MPRNALVKKAAFIFSNFENRMSEVLARKNAITCLKEELAFVHVQNPFVLKPDEANDFFIQQYEALRPHQESLKWRHRTRQRSFRNDFRFAVMSLKIKTKKNLCEGKCLCQSPQTLTSKADPQTPFVFKVIVLMPKRKRPRTKYGSPNNGLPIMDGAQVNFSL